MKNKYFIAISLILLFLSSCSLISRAISSESDRKSELYSLAPRLVKPYTWQSFNELIPYLDKNKGPDILFKLENYYENMKIKEVKVEQVDFENNSKKSYQLLQVYTYSAPTYVVRSHLDQFTWKFTIKDGWKITNVDIDIGEKSDINLNPLP